MAHTSGENSRDELIRLVSNIVFSPDEDSQFIQATKQIYDYIDNNIKSEDSKLKAKAPPIEVFAYATRNILYPTVLLNLIPNLLELLPNIERYRNSALEKAQHVLALEEYRAATNRPPLGLSNTQRELLDAIVAEHDSLRQIYISIVIQFCMLDIYHSWTTNMNVRATTYKIADYFPMIHSANQIDSPHHTFHVSLSEQEIAQFRASGRDCCNYIADTVTWAKQNAQPGKTLSDILHSDECLSEFPCTVDHHKLRELIEDYLHVVEGRLNELKSLFG